MADAEQLGQDKTVTESGDMGQDSVESHEPLDEGEVETEPDKNLKVEGKKESKAKGWVNTIISFIALIVILVFAYMAFTFLMGSDYNVDALLTGII